MKFGDSRAYRSRGLRYRFNALVGPNLLDDLGAELDALLATTAPPTTARRPWLDEWVRAFTDFEPWAVVVRDDSDALAGLALLARRRRAGHVEIVPMGYGPSDYVRLHARDDAATEALATALVGALTAIRGPWRLVLSQVPADDPVVMRVANALPHAELRPGDPSPVLRFSKGDVLRGHLSKGFIREARRGREQLEEAGTPPELELVRDSTAIARLFPEIEEVRRRRDRALRRAEEMDSPEWEQFRSRVLARLAALGEVELAVLRVGGTVAAYGIGLLDGSTYQKWEGRFDPAFAACGPGRLLTAAILEHLFEIGEFTVYDYMRGDEAHKLRASNDLIPAEQLIAWSSARFRALERRARSLRALVQRGAA